MSFSTAVARADVAGTWSERFSPVARELAQQLAAAPKTGAALCIYQHGQPVFDGFGGVRNARGEAWQADTQVMAFSTGKGCAAALLHALVERGAARYDDPVVRHWPELASVNSHASKRAITLRHVLSHRAGLFRLGDMIDDFWQVLDFDAMVARLEQAQPAHAPGAASAYHGISFSWLAGELIRRLSGQSVAAALHELLVVPLGLDGAYFGLPEQELARCAELVAPREPITLGSHALRLAHPLARTLSGGRVRLDDLRAALVLPASQPLSWNDLRLRRACLPSSTGVFTARSLARIYAVLAGDGSLDGVRVLSPTTLLSVREPQSHPNERDRVSGAAAQWRLGYHAIHIAKRVVPGAFGHCGYRGSGAFAEPSRGLAFAYVHNAKAGTQPLGGVRFQRLARVALECAGAWA